MVNQRSRILLLIPHLGGGGAERVLELVARGLPSERFDIHIGLVCASPGDAAQFPVHIQIHSLDAQRVRYASRRIIKLVKTIRPQLILSGMVHLSLLVLLLRRFFPRGIKIVVRQNGALPRIKFSLTAAAYRFLYPHADGIIAQSRAMANEICTQIPVRPDRVRALNNPIQFPPEQEQFKIKTPKLHLLAMGRLAPEKGFDLLLPAVSSLRHHHPRLQLTIAGEGPERSRLQQLIVKLDLQNTVQFIGYCERPFESVDADIFVLSSRSEGMPNALLEAAAHGLPIVSTPCSQGVIDLLINQPGIFMTKEINSLALEITIESAIHAHRAGLKYRHQFVQPYEFHAAVGAYGKFFDEVLRR